MQPSLHLLVLPAHCSACSALLIAWLAHDMQRTRISIFGLRLVCRLCPRCDREPFLQSLAILLGCGSLGILQIMPAQVDTRHHTRTLLFAAAADMRVHSEVNTVCVRADRDSRVQAHSLCVCICVCLCACVCVPQNLRSPRLLLLADVEIEPTQP